MFWGGQRLFVQKTGQNEKENKNRTSAREGVEEMGRQTPWGLKLRAYSKNQDLNDSFYYLLH